MVIPRRSPTAGVGWCVGLAVGSSAVSGVLFLLAIDGHLSEIFQVERLVGQVPGNAELFRVGAADHRSPTRCRP